MVATLNDITLWEEKDGTITVSSFLTHGHAATVSFDLDGSPYVVWAVAPSYRGGIDDDLIKEAVANRYVLTCPLPFD